MGIWDQLRSISDMVLNRNDPKACGSTRLSDAAGINVVAQKLEDHFPQTDHREKIGQIITNLGRFAVDSVVSESLKGFTGGLQVYKIVKEGLKDHPSSHATNGSNNRDLTLTMEQIQAQLEKMQKEMKSMKKQQYELSTCAKPESQLEKMHEDMNNTKQQIENLTRCAKVSDPLKELSAEPTEGSAPSKNDVKRVMIRSRL